MVRKEKLRSKKKTTFKKVAGLLMRAHLRSRKESEAKKDAEEPGEVPAGPETPVPAGDETPVPAGAGEAPATPQPVPEAALWPEVGVKVAVGVENLAHFLRLGEIGVSEGPVTDEPGEVNVSLDSPLIVKSMRMPRSLLVPVGKPMSNMRLWDRISEGVKRDLLFKLGVRDPRDEVLPTTASLSLTMWGEYVPIGLRPTEECEYKYKFVSPFFVRAFVDGFEMMRKVEANELLMNFAELEVQSHRQDVRQKLLKDWWHQHEVLLVCCCDEASGSSALLALRKAPISVRFYEVLGGRVSARSLQVDWIRVLLG